MPTGNCTEVTNSNTKEYLAHVHLTDKATQGRYARFSSLLLFAAFFLSSFACWLDLQDHSKVTITIPKVTARRVKEALALCISFLRARHFLPEVSS